MRYSFCIYFISDGDHSGLLLTRKERDKPQPVSAYFWIDDQTGLYPTQEIRQHCNGGCYKLECAKKYDKQPHKYARYRDQELIFGELSDLTKTIASHPEMITSEMNLKQDYSHAKKKGYPEVLSRFFTIPRTPFAEFFISLEIFTECVLNKSYGQDHITGRAEEFGFRDPLCPFPEENLYYFLTAEKLLDAKYPVTPQWFRNNGPIYSDFEMKKFYRRKEVDLLKEKILSNRFFGLEGKAATAKSLIVRTMIYELYKEGQTSIYYFDINTCRNFDHIKLVHEILKLKGVFIIENIHLESQKAEWIYQYLKHVPHRHILFTFRPNPEEFQGTTLFENLTNNKTLVLEPFTDVEELIRHYCSDSSVPQTVWDKREDIITVSKDDFWFFIYALRGCSKLQGTGTPQDWIKEDIRNRLRNLENCKDSHADQYPGIIMTLSPLYKQEVLTDENFLIKHGFTRAALNGLMERGEITWQLRSDNFFYGLIHSSQATAYWNHGKAYINKPALRDQEEFFYDYVISDTHNGLEAAIKSPYSKNLFARLESKGILSDVILRENSIEKVSQFLIHIYQQKKTIPLDEQILQRIVSADNFYYSCVCVSAISLCDKDLAKEMCENIIVSKVIEDLFTKFGFQEFILATRIVANILHSKSEKLWKSVLPQILLQFDNLDVREFLRGLHDIIESHPPVAQEITKILNEELVAKKLIRCETLPCIICGVRTILSINNNKGKTLWKNLQNNVLTMLYNETASEIASVFSTLIDTDNILATEFFKSIEYSKLASTLMKEAKWDEVANIIKTIQSVDTVSKNELYRAFNEDEQKQIDSYL